jgi:hypothetical protein
LFGAGVGEVCVGGPCQEEAEAADAEDDVGVNGLSLGRLLDWLFCNKGFEAWGIHTPERERFFDLDWIEG